MSWFNTLNITGLWNGGSPAPVGAGKDQRLPVRDDYASIEHAADKVGADNVKTFSFSTAGDFVMVDVDVTSIGDYATYRARATIDGSTPSAAMGFVCRSGNTSYLPFPMTGAEVKVYAPAGTVVAVQVGRYA